MATNNFTADQNRELGETISGLMLDIVDATGSLPGFEVENATIEFHLGDDIGDLFGKWRVTVERLGDA